MNDFFNTTLGQNTSSLLLPIVRKKKKVDILALIKLHRTLRKIRVDY